MLGRKTFTQEEIDHARSAIDAQLAAYDDLAPGAALEAFSPLFFNSLLLALDRPFVHRVRMVTGKDGTPVNEVELLVESLMNNGGVLRGNNVIKLVPEQSVLELELGSEIRLDEHQFRRLADAFFTELEAKFVS